ncbi:hypothetical protein HanXRQr2_Chr09g0370651 [Helianthus annuus]|uniref:Uncharacterized protein n=1 Tax=Helianthus annuus TaxID=4232 RepID=A0A9K3I413_HELAN|nr:hypothetical protein HanXRQr2_Chr09g0370651 [Helianthus annuus]KAJ0891698.1 hypothetical protein HanPSC8_Chr09g0357101 [Helianthus annuus]
MLILLYFQFNIFPFFSYPFFFCLVSFLCEVWLAFSYLGLLLHWAATGLPLGSS